jgi:hypothetical protein
MELDFQAIEKVGDLVQDSQAGVLLQGLHFEMKQAHWEGVH